LSGSRSEIRAEFRQERGGLGPKLCASFAIRHSESHTFPVLRSRASAPENSPAVNSESQRVTVRFLPLSVRGSANTGF